MILTEHERMSVNALIESATRDDVYVHDKMLYLGFSEQEVRQEIYEHTQLRLAAMMGQLPCQRVPEPESAEKLWFAIVLFAVVGCGIWGFFTHLWEVSK